MLRDRVGQHRLQAGQQGGEPGRTLRVLPGRRPLRRRERDDGRHCEQQHRAAQQPEAAAEPEPAPIPEPVAVAEEPVRRPKKELPAEGIVVSSTSTATEEAKPKKAGWWQRGFFGG